MKPGLWALMVIFVAGGLSWNARRTSPDAVFSYVSGPLAGQIVGQVDEVPAGPNSLADRMTEADAILAVEIIAVGPLETTYVGPDPIGQSRVITARIVGSVVPLGASYTDQRVRLVMRTSGRTIGGTDLGSYVLGERAQVWAVVRGVGGLTSSPPLDTPVRLLAAVGPGGSVDVLSPTVDVGPVGIAQAMGPAMSGANVLSLWVEANLGLDDARGADIQSFLDAYRSLIRPERADRVLIDCDHPKIDEFTDATGRPACNP